MPMRTLLVRWTALGVSLPLLLAVWEADRQLQDLAQAAYCNVVQTGPVGPVIGRMHTASTLLPISPCGNDPLDHPPLSLATTMTGPSSGSPVAFTVWNTIADEPRTGPLIWPQGIAQGDKPPAMHVAVDGMPYYSATPPPDSRPGLLAQLLTSSLAPPRQPVASPSALAVYPAEAAWWKLS
jgi:hypothetical protein